MLSKSRAWLIAIENATSPLQRYNFNNSNADEDWTQESLEALVLLEKSLIKKSKDIDRVPKKLPPKTSMDESGSGSFNAQSGGIGNAVKSENNFRAHRADVNPFAAIQDHDDDDDENSRNDNSIDSDDDDEDAGDEPVLNELTTRRLLIRICTSISEVARAKARMLYSSTQWNFAWQAYQIAFQKASQALEYADSEIARQMHLSQTMATTMAASGSVIVGTATMDLVHDAQIVAVAAESLNVDREKCLKYAHQQEQYLTRKLEPQWETRDQVKERMGDRWFNNPTRKNDHYRMRQDDEEALRNIQYAIEQIEGLDTELLQNNSLELLMRAKGEGGVGGSRSLTSRNNGLRPDYNISGRVPFEQYPDPTEFGWTFTGSNERSRVEFFEKDDVKLDWYYSTGGLKTSLDHPTQGKTQLFASREKITSEIFIQILLDPRTHTNIRYQRRGRGGRNSNRGFGRGGRGRGRRGGRGGRNSHSGHY